jgi:hypothetical protein
MSLPSQLMYKWLMPLAAVKRLRFVLESYLHRPLDWRGECDRNVLMYESAAPLAHLYSPLITLTDTFILQEFFVPVAAFGPWMDALEPLLTRGRHERVNLLNITIRFVVEDGTTALPYAPGDRFAFVFYWRLPSTADADAELRRVHERLAGVALSLGGTFYLPYRHHYSVQELRAAYPTIDAFFALKARFDPGNVFSNEWYADYGPRLGLPVARTAATMAPLADAGVIDGGGAAGGGGGGGGGAVMRAVTKRKAPSTRRQAPSAGDDADVVVVGGGGDGGVAVAAVAAPAPAPGSASGPGSVALPVVEDRRRDSYSRLAASEEGRQRLEEFLHTVFTVESPTALYATVLQAVRNPANGGNDLEIFAEVARWCANRSVWHVPTRVYRTFAQLAFQRRDVIRQLRTVLSAIGLGGAASLHGVALIGDPGRYVETLRAAFHPRGPVYVLNDTWGGVAGLVERGTLFSGASFVPFDFSAVADVPVPSSSLDLVTMFQGLHHLPQPRLRAFLDIVMRCVACRHLH